MRKMTHERLLQRLSYDPETGIFQWKQPMPGIPVARAGCINSVWRYRTISFDGRPYRASVLAWFYVTGQWPKELIDHINRVRDDDRFVNLREATHWQNSANKKLSRLNTTGYNGVSLRRSGAYVAQGQVRGVKRYFGSFDDIWDARDAYERGMRDRGEFIPENPRVYENMPIAESPRSLRQRLANKRRAAIENRAARRSLMITGD